MIINKPKLEQEILRQKHLSWRSRLILFQFLLLISLTLVFYWYYSTTTQKLQTAQQLEQFSQTLSQEKANCNKILSQGQGEFSQYEYCNRLLSVFH